MVFKIGSPNGRRQINQSRLNDNNKAAVSRVVIFLKKKKDYGV